MENNSRLKAAVVLGALGLAMIMKPQTGTADDQNKLEIKKGGKTVLVYRAKPLTNPKGGANFRASNFIHPLRTPSGFDVTDTQPPDHLHHMGLWWPWKYIETDGRKVLCWELQQGDGIIRAQGAESTPQGFTSKSIYVDRKAPGGPQTLLNETLNAKVSDIFENPARGYNLDLKIIHETAGSKPVAVSKYRYSGFAIRGTAIWNKDNSTVLTSEGKKYDAANFTRAKWVRIEGSAAGGNTAGVLMMSHPDNYDFPELLRAWDSKTHNGAIFVNFNSVQDKPWIFKPGKEYARKYRLFVYDGTITAAEAEQLWQNYKAEK
jgi:hypothetical protein